MRIKTLALANGDYFENATTSENLLECITNKEFIKISIGKKEIYINSEFVISFEL